MAPKMTVECTAVTAQKPKVNVLKPTCPCKLLPGGHFHSECARLWEARRAAKKQSGEEKTQVARPLTRAEKEQRLQEEQRQRDAAVEARFGKPTSKAQEEQRKRDAAVEAHFGTRDDVSTVASETGDDWNLPVPGADDDWSSPAPVGQLPVTVAKPLVPVPTPQVPTEKPLFTFTMAEWKELQKVKKLLRDIEVIEGMQAQGKKLYPNQLAKLERRAELEGSLVMVKDRAGCARPNLL